jgi:ABC-type lipoprotein export system ATPase subunit
MILEAKEINKSYGSTKVLSNINLKIEKAQFYGVSGPSGCGKTTLLSILALLDKPDSGTLILKGQNITSITKDEAAYIRNSQYGFIFQAYNMLMHLSVLDNILLPFEYGTLVKDDVEKKALFWLKKVGLGDYKNKKIFTLSGGEQQRVAIARALIRDPDIVFADEPTGNLDAKNSHIVLQILKQISQEENKSVIMVSHDSHALKYCDKILTLDKL